MSQRLMSQRLISQHRAEYRWVIWAMLKGSKSSPFAFYHTRGEAETQAKWLERTIPGSKFIVAPNSDLTVLEAANLMQNRSV